MAVYQTTIHTPGSLAAGTLCLDLVGNAQQNGTRVRMYPANGTPAQSWDIPVFGELHPPQKPGIYLSASNDLSVDAGEDQSAAILNNADPQGWIFNPITKLVFKITKHVKADCLTRDATNDNVFSAPCDMASAAQKWDLN
ncbi:hypothetical protein H0H87_009091 [Tephrocybe sp. NHM501043]|nr:hypothetical protein H0H87_009091 [Tephrocybe sp. NHM501043]